MWKSHIKPGVEYALREKRGLAAPLQRVRIVVHIRGNRWKAEWIDPDPGLVHFVESGHLLSRSCASGRFNATVWKPATIDLKM
jgi:hypothetical protein